MTPHVSDYHFSGEEVRPTNSELARYEGMASDSALRAVSDHSKFRRLAMDEIDRLRVENERLVGYVRALKIELESVK